MPGILADGEYSLFFFGGAFSHAIVARSLYEECEPAARGRLHRRFGELLEAEYRATAAALSRMGRMNCSLHLPSLTAESLGEAIMFFQLATGYAGVWYGIDPFDQPAVEEGNVLTRKYLAGQK